MWYLLPIHWLLLKIQQLPFLEFFCKKNHLIVDDSTNTFALISFAFFYRWIAFILLYYIMYLYYQWRTLSSSFRAFVYDDNDVTSLWTLFLLLMRRKNLLRSAVSDFIRILATRILTYSGIEKCFNFFLFILKISAIKSSTTCLPSIGILANCYSWNYFQSLACLAYFNYNFIYIYIYI